MNATLDAAIELLDAGYWPTPLRPLSLDLPSDPQRGKKPLWSGWGKVRPSDTRLIEQYGALPDCGLGVLLGPVGDLIDIDMDDPRKGGPSIHQIFGEDGPPPTRSWYTRRGQHWLFRWDDRFLDISKHSSNWKTFAGLELRIGGEGKQVGATIPPSQQADGRPREWIDPEAPFAPLPESAIRVILENCLLPRPRVQIPIQIDQEWDRRKERSLAWLAHRDPAVSGAAGRTKLWNTIIELKGFCQNTSELLYLSSEYNLICQPPFSDRELRDTVERAASVSPVSWGYKLNDPSRERLPLRSVKSLQAGPLARIEVGEVAEDQAADWEATDIGNARRFAHEYSSQARYCPGWGKWLVWDGHRFLHDTRDRATALAIEAIRRWTQMSGVENDRTFLKWYADSQNRSRIEAMLRLARALPGVGIDVNDLDADPWKINTLSGILDLKTGELAPPDPSALCSRLAPVKFEPEAKSEAWESFLSQITCGNPDVVDYLQRVGGYSLTGSTAEQQFWTFWGTGRNGKGVMLECWLAAMGDYACTVAADLFLAKQDQQHPTSLMELQNRRFVFTDEIEEGKKLDEGQMKRLTGGLPIKARRMRQDEVEFLPLCKIFLLTNDKPEIRGTDAAIWARLRLVNFPVKFVGPGEEPVAPPLFLPKTLGLAERLKNDDRSAIFAWLFAGCQAWRSRGLGVPDSVTRSTDEYRAEQDRVANFVLESCEPGELHQVGSGDLYKAYRSWCSENGFKPLGSGNFKNQILRLGFKWWRNEKSRFWSGLTLSPGF